MLLLNKSIFSNSLSSFPSDGFSVNLRFYNWRQSIEFPAVNPSHAVSVRKHPCISLQAFGLPGKLIIRGSSRYRANSRITRPFGYRHRCRPYRSGYPGAPSRSCRQRSLGVTSQGPHQLPPGWVRINPAHWSPGGVISSILVHRREAVVSLLRHTLLSQAVRQSPGSFILTQTLLPYRTA